MPLFGDVPGDLDTRYDLPGFVPHGRSGNLGISYPVVRTDGSLHRVDIAVLEHHGYSATIAQRVSPLVCCITIFSDVVPEDILDDLV